MEFVGCHRFGGPAAGRERALLQSPQERCRPGDRPAAVCRGFSMGAETLKKGAKQIGRSPRE